ncbi:MAG: LptF/LptG family permease, partial [Planctomycetes bacterium]|nr:LptF/LptG family permease [Planctomycetota bacterium]
MKILDRYIIRQFLINYLVLLAVLMLLIITIDLIINLDEFVQVSERLGEAGGRAKLAAVVGAVFGFYWPKVFLFFIYAAGVLPIGAAGFTLAGMIRNRELTAMLAGGVSLYRVALPLLLVGCVLSCLTLLDYELVIPRLRDKLIVEHHHVKQGGIGPYRLQFVPDLAPDHNNDGLPDQSLLFNAAEFDADDQAMTRVSILQRNAHG